VHSVRCRRPSTTPTPATPALANTALANTALANTALAAAAVVVGLVAGAALLPAVPATAAPKATTLVVSLAVQPRPPLPGKSVSYTVNVHNAGPVSAAGVQLELSTSLGLNNVGYQVSSGKCYRSATKTVCRLGTVAANADASAKISGTLPASAPLYATVDVHATVTSSTPLTAEASSDLVYPLGGQSPVPTPSLPATVAPVVAATAPQTGTVSWLEPSAKTRTLSISFAVLVLALIFAGRWWERRRTHRRSPAATVTVPGPANDPDPARNDRIGV
jgi:uncharacterized repeat protein (TIGR01451 family)